MNIHLYIGDVTKPGVDAVNLLFVMYIFSVENLISNLKSIKSDRIYVDILLYSYISGLKVLEIFFPGVFFPD